MPLALLVRLFPFLLVGCAAPDGPGSDTTMDGGGTATGDGGTTMDGGGTTTGDGGTTTGDGGTVRAVCADVWPQSPDWTLPGPYLSGTRIHTGTLEFRGDLLPLYVRITYPATVAGLDGPVDASGGPYPVLIFMHAYGAAPDQYEWFVQTLASRGWVIIAPEHDEGDWNTTEGGWYDSHPWLAERALQLLMSWEEEAGGEWEGTLDLDRIALGGHSHGGGSVLRLAQS